MRRLMLTGLLVLALPAVALAGGSQKSGPAVQKAPGRVETALQVMRLLEAHPQLRPVHRANQREQGVGGELYKTLFSAALSDLGFQVGHRLAVSSQPTDPHFQLVNAIANISLGFAGGWSVVSALNAKQLLDAKHQANLGTLKQAAERGLSDRRAAVPAPW